MATFALRAMFCACEAVLSEVPALPLITAALLHPLVEGQPDREGSASSVRIEPQR